MKKTTAIKIILLLLLSLSLCFTAFACTNDQSSDVTVKSMSVVTSHNGQYFLGDDVDLSEITFEVVYSNKEKKTVTLDDTMLSEEDSEKFFRAGTHSVSINYEGNVCILQIEVIDVAEEGKFLAKFYSLGGTAVSSLATTQINAFSVPERTGYSFDGWYTDISFSGDRVVEPYVLTKNTDFYAKWLDNRTYKVRFVDIDNTVLYEETIHHGEKIDVNSYEYPLEPIGKTFTGWNVTNGDADNVTVDLIVKASFAIDQCTVSISYLNSNNEIYNVKKTLNYDEEFNINEYTLPTKEGYSSKWVMYYNHSEDENEDDYMEVPESKILVLKESYTTICAYFTINTYDIAIYNGKATQTEANLKSGEIDMERVYANAAAAKNFSVEWNTDFDFSKYTQDPNISEPTVLIDASGNKGYTAQWCFVITDTTGVETWYNTSGYIWDEDTEKFVEQEWAENEGINQWTLNDSDGKYIALIKNKTLTAIKGNVTVKAKYIKREYSVSLYRVMTGTQTKLVTFTMKYYSDFDIYSNVMYNPSSVSSVTAYTIDNPALSTKSASYNLTSGAPDEIEQFYLLENTQYDIKHFAEGYYITGELAEDYLKDDWSINWYTSTSMADGTCVDFIGGESIEIKNDNVNLYCKDTDNRLYEIYFYYDFNFSSMNYGTISPPVIVKENESVAQPLDGKLGSITCELNGIQLSYEFIGWFDTPYDMYLRTGYRGKAITKFNTRTESTYYYAHYQCNTTYNINIFDTTQSTAYIGIDGNSDENFPYTAYSVAPNTISYTLPAGTLYNIGMIYKGVSHNDGSRTNGQVYYKNYMKNKFYSEQFLADYNENGLGMYKYLVTKFGTVAEMQSVLRILKAYMTVYSDAKSTIYNHNYTYSNEEYEYLFGEGGFYQKVKMNNSVADEIESYTSDFSNIKSALISAGYNKITMDKLGPFQDFIADYVTFIRYLYNNGFTKELCGFDGLTQHIVNDFSARSDYENIAVTIFILEEYIDFFNKYDASRVEEELTPKYDTSKKYLNAAYGFDIDAGEEKYSFSGWYTDSSYMTQYSQDFDFGDEVVCTDITLYAKWTDVTKGTEGLVYEEVTANGAPAYVLVDFVNRNQYETLPYKQDKNNYYVTRNDNGDIPVSIATGIELQIPATIDKYLDKTTEAATKKDDWSNHYSLYYVLSSGAYIQASATYNEKTTYYKKETYPVIGIDNQALRRYAEKIKSLTIPLNLYFVEEGALENCFIETINRTAPKAGEIALSYVILDGVCALYQWDINTQYTAVIGKGSGNEYGSSSAKTIIGYAKNNVATEYTLLDDTVVIGQSAFFYATNLISVNGVQSLTKINDKAFMGATKLTTFGTAIKTLTVPTSVTVIGENAFYGCGTVTSVVIDGNSSLSEVKKNAFSGTAWYFNSRHKAVIVLPFTNASGSATGIILGFGDGAYSNYDKESDGQTDKKYNSSGVVTIDGEYYGISADDTIALYNEHGKLVYVIINIAIASIAEGAFYNKDFAYIVINDASKLEKINDKAFGSCPNLEKITINGATNAITLGTDVFYGRSEEAKVKVHFDTETAKNIATSSWDEYLALVEFV